MEITIICDTKTPEMIRDEISTKLNFPSYYGHNWDAWHECIRDLEWLNVVSIKVVLVDYASEESVLLGLLTDSILYWKKNLEQQEHDRLPHKELVVELR